MTKLSYLQTGQITCHDAAGCEIDCDGSGQDAEFQRGMPWPKPRFEIRGETVIDRLTGLVWCRNANLAEFPLTWQEGLDYVAHMNRDSMLDYSDWRLPNRRELRSLISHQTKRPALPEGQPFADVFNGWYWSSTTAMISPAHAWYVDMDGGRMFYGGKDQSFMVWPVRGHGNGVLAVTGQTQCYAATGKGVACAGTGQDGESTRGSPWPMPRFQASGQEVIDRWSKLCWRLNTGSSVSWAQAFCVIADLNRQARNTHHWRLPSINELESLVDCDAHNPALPVGHPFGLRQDAYWSSTTSFYEPDWAWALYLDKGAVGVGQKTQARFNVWPVRNLGEIKI